jgi:Ca-activated chloride channel homolog
MCSTPLISRCFPPSFLKVHLGMRLARRHGEEDLVKRVAVVPALLVVLASGLAAQQQPSSSAPAAPAAVGSSSSGSQPQVFRTSTNLVPLNVTVTDANKQFVRGLTASDFSVFEDGVQQQVQFFETTDVPLDLIILLDTSSSMSDKMDVVHEAAVGFLKTLKAGDRGAVVAFADGVDVLQTLTTDRQALEQAVRRTVARGATALHNAIYISLKQFGRGAQPDADVRRQAIAVLSDGEDTSSLVTFEDVLAVARKSGVSIYPIALQSKYAAARLVSTGQRRFFSESEYAMRTLAQETGAQAFFPLQIFELKGIYAAIAQELASQYSIAYSPANTRADGRFRRIVVRLDTRPDLRLRTRTGYTADAVRATVAPVVHQER